ncbi:IS3 family transposase [Corynebacterium rhinophilum]|uniref:IS3 family transposase n=1 Tax=Corynebacterium rhinophilum TaxID=3050197 RepID=UPI00397BDF90
MLIARFTRSEKDSDEVYGAPRITAELAERYQISVNRKTVAKRMRLMGIEGISPRAFVPVTTIQAKRKSTFDDLVKRMCDTGELNRVWMSDIMDLAPVWWTPDIRPSRVGKIGNLPPCPGIPNSSNAMPWPSMRTMRASR